MKIKRFCDIINESEDIKPRYEYGCLMVELDVPEWKNDILSIIDEDDIYDDENGDFGLEDKPHITLFYGVHSDVDKNDIIDSVNEYEIYPTGITLQNISIFESDEYDVVKFDIDDTDELFLNLHNHIKDNFPNTQTFPDYHPHTTLSYVEKGKGKKYIQSLEEPYIVDISKIFYSYPTNDGQSKNEVDVIKF